MQPFDSLEPQQKLNIAQKYADKALQYRLVEQRLNDLRNNNIPSSYIHWRHVGSGGVGRTIELQDEYRIQLSCGYGRWNYAWCIVIPKET